MPHFCGFPGMHCGIPATGIGDDAGGMPKLWKPRVLLSNLAKGRVEKREFRGRDTSRDRVGYDSA